MRQWAYLPSGGPSSGFRKVMVYTGEGGTHVFLYDSPDAVFCSADEFYENLADALEAWEDKITPEGWHVIDDPRPGCQHDSILPIRVKGRDQGKPQWGEYEVLKDGEWADFQP